MNNKYDYLIVGSGLFGATFAYKARQAGKTCLVIDKRPQLGGNVYCESVEGINVHKYGAHIFHTSNKQVWDFVNSIVEFNRYTNSPVANYKGKLYNLPFNMNTFYQMWGVTTPEEAQAKIDEQKAEAIAKMKADGVTEPRNLEEQAQVLIGKDIYEKLIKEYTEKQWGRKCTDLPAFIIKRLPVRLVFDNNYFNDKYQGIPIGGYNKLIDGLLEGVDTLTDTDFFAPITDKTIKDFAQFGIDLSDFSSKTIQEAWKEIASNLVYTGQLDQYFDYRFGKLDWRTVSFKTRVENTPNYQGNAVVNYTSHDEPYTRVIEHKHFEMFGQEVYNCPKTVISEEYSTEYKDGMEPYYPVNNDSNNALVEAYRKLAHQENVMFPEDLSPLPIGEDRGGTVLFGGRLAEYKYYDMAPIIEKVLTLPL
jgi:UDP-galactopyranose mutase